MRFEDTLGTKIDSDIYIILLKMQRNYFTHDILYQNIKKSSFEKLSFISHNLPNYI